MAGNNPAQKKFKQQEHKRERRAVNQIVNKEYCESKIHPKQFGNEWSSPRDGKTWFGGCDNRKPSQHINWHLEYKKWMRK